MNKFVTFLIFSLGFQWAQAQSFSPGTQVNCSDSQGTAFTLKVLSGHPTRLHPYDDASISFQNQTDFLWLKYEEFKNYGLGAVHIFKAQSQAEIHIVESVRHSRLCGRGSCDAGKAPKTLSAKFISSLGQIHYYACTQKH
jgi:hypothetical protein